MDKGKKVTIRLLPSKVHVYPEFKKLVIEEQGSDVCFVLTWLMEAYTKAVRASQTQVPYSPVELKLSKQNVQINMGCTINYNTRKARRVQDFDKVEVAKNRFLPLLVEEFPNLDDNAKRFWRKRLIDAGIIPPSVSTPTSKSRFYIFFRLRKYCMTLYDIVKEIAQRVIERLKR